MATAGCIATRTVPGYVIRGQLHERIALSKEKAATSNKNYSIANKMQTLKENFENSSIRLLMYGSYCAFLVFQMHKTAESRDLAPSTASGSVPNKKAAAAFNLFDRNTAKKLSVNSSLR